MGQNEKLGLLPDEVGKEQLLDEYVHLLVRSSRFLGTYFETGRTGRGRRASMSRRYRHECNVATAIKWVMNSDFDISFILPADNPENDTQYRFVRFYGGDYDQNPHLISSRGEAVDIVDFCKAMHHGARIDLVPNSRLAALSEIA
jgi:hypothetical protein